MAWLIAAFVLIAAVGPVFWLLPSKRDRQLGALRTAARRAGLAVEVTTLPKMDAAAEERVSAGGRLRDVKVDCACYRLPLTKPFAAAPCWLLLRHAGGGLDGWTTLTPPDRLPPDTADYWRAVTAIADKLPGDCIGLEARSSNIGWYGRERLDGADPDVVAQAISCGLAAIGKLHAELDERDG